MIRTKICQEMLDKAGNLVTRSPARTRVGNHAHGLFESILVLLQAEQSVGVAIGPPQRGHCRTSASPLAYCRGDPLTSSACQACAGISPPRP